MVPAPIANRCVSTASDIDAGLHLIAIDEVVIAAHDQVVGNRVIAISVPLIPQTIICYMNLIHVSSR